MGAWGQVIIDSFNGKNTKGTAAVGFIVAGASNALLAASNPALTISLTGIANLYLSFPTFREASKKVSEAERKAVGLNSPKNFFSWINFYRYGVPILLVGGLGTIAMVGYGLGTVATSQIAATGTSTLLSSSTASAFNWTSSLCIPLGTLCTNLLWNNKAPGIVDKLLSTEPSYIDDISANFSSLEKLEEFAYGNRYKNLLVDCQRIAPGTVNKLKLEVNETIKLTAEKAQKDWVEAEQVLSRHKKNLAELENRRKILFEITDEWGPLLMRTLDDLKNKKQVFLKSELSLEKEAKEISEKFSHVRDDENRLSNEIDDSKEELERINEKRVSEKKAAEVQKLTQDILRLNKKIELLSRISINLRIKKEVNIFEKKTTEILQSKSCDIREIRNVDKLHENWLIAMQKAKDEKIACDNDINNARQLLSKSLLVRNMNLAVQLRVRRALEAIKNQFPEGDPLQAHRDVKKQIEDTFRSVIQEESVVSVAFPQIFRELLGHLENSPIPTVRLDEKSEPVLMVPAYDRQRTSKHQADEFSVPVLPSPTASQSKIL